MLKKYSFFRLLPALCLPIVLSLSFSSCKDENAPVVVADTNTLGLPKTMSQLYQDGNQVGDLNGKVSYDGSKITEIYYNTTQKKVFTYTGDFITKIEEYRRVGALEYWSICNFNFKISEYRS